MASTRNLTISVDADQAEWLRVQPAGVSRTLRRLIKAEMDVDTLPLSIAAAEAHLRDLREAQERVEANARAEAEERRRAKEEAEHRAEEARTASVAEDLAEAEAWWAEAEADGTIAALSEGARRNLRAKMNLPP